MGKDSLKHEKVFMASALLNVFPSGDNQCGTGGI